MRSSAARAWIWFCLTAVVLVPRADAAVFQVQPGANLQAVVNSAASGDTVRFAPGVYHTQCIDVFKRLTLVAEQPHTAILQGHVTAPTKANEEGQERPAACGFNVGRRSSDGTRIEGLEFRYFDNAIYVRGMAGLRVIGNRFVSNYGDGIAIRDTDDAQIHGNVFLDPYLPLDEVATLEPLWAGGSGGVYRSDAQMDYGISIYGSLRPRVHHNYFFGVFNQTLSFKNSNRDAYVGYNTFEGYNLTALFFGQEPGSTDSYPEFGLSGWEGGQIVAEKNVFRAVYGLHPGTGTLAVYRANSPIRVRYVDGNVSLRDNVVEIGGFGITVECGLSGCPLGTIELKNNLLAGRGITSDGVVHDIGRCGVQVDAGTTAQVSMFQNTLVHFRTALCAEGGVLDVANTEFFHSLIRAVSGTPASIDYGNHYDSGPVMGPHSTGLAPNFAGVPDFRVRDAMPTLTPNRGFTEAFHLTTQSPGLYSGRGGTFKGAFPLTAEMFEDGFE
jgi:hypothetical protein